MILKLFNVNRKVLCVFSGFYEVIKGFILILICWGLDNYLVKNLC